MQLPDCTVGSVTKILAGKHLGDSLSVAFRLLRDGPRARKETR